MRSQIARTIAVLLTAMGMLFGGTTAATAGTADYHYTCSSGPWAGTWTMPKGTPLSHCWGGTITVRLNGRVQEVLHVNASGKRYEPNPGQVTCAIMIVGTYATAMSGGKIVKLLTRTLTKLGLPACKV